jgi:hypothetical protein
MAIARVRMTQSNKKRGAEAEPSTREAPQSHKHQQPIDTREKLNKQISFYCTTEFSKRIHAEKVRRGLTIQEMITKALAEYFSRAPVDEVRADRAAFYEKLRRDGRAPANEDPDYEWSVWLDLCAKYFQRMPKAKRQILEEFIMLDLKHYGSSRLKKD